MIGLAGGEVMQEKSRAEKEDKDSGIEAGTHNRLIHEKSPYLLQHADNPVDWYPWGDEAFDRAAKENKPIFLSIGYSTCHWCHVMEHESFESPEVAALMNEAFVSIKVDREERPDIDSVYMTVCQMLTGGGGWPLTVIMTPDRRPFFAGTYFPREDRFGRTGLLGLVPRIKELWDEKHEKVLESAGRITKALQEGAGIEPGPGLGESALESAYGYFDSVFDSTWGGFGKAPKFPTPHNLLFLLRYWKRTKNGRALDMVEKTLQTMRGGGIYDQLGFGFHRYATDSTWLVPHFEKMLYDQALLAMAYTEAYGATGRQEYRKTVEEIFTYVLRDMTSPQGGFYSAEDADSQGEEGKFYLWTADEIRDVLDGEEADLVMTALGVEEQGNFGEEAAGGKTGRNILHLREAPAGKAKELGIDEKELEQRLDEARLKLFEAREKRVHPSKDDKILTDWNGLMIAALAMASRTFDEPAYAQAAGRAASFILGEMKEGEGGRLLHRYREGQADIRAFSADYAFLIWGLLELYEATFDAGQLRLALELNSDFIDHYLDAESGGFFQTADDGEDLLVRRKSAQDGALPSANSVAALNLARLGRMTGDSGLDEKAREVFRAASVMAGKFPEAHTQLLVGLDFSIGPSYEIVIAGKPGAEDTMKMFEMLRKHYIPNKVVLFRPDEESPDITKIAAFTKNQKSLEGKATAYVCMDFHCRLPTTDPCVMLRQLARDDVES